MKEKDVIDFTKLEKDEDGNCIDDEGNPIGCELCYTHEKAYKMFSEDENVNNMVKIPNPRCPYCNQKLIGRIDMTTMAGNAVVSEQNGSIPEGNIGFYSIWECEHCKDKFDNTQLFALMPEPITYNANHDVYYTGGKRFVESKDLQELCQLINDKIMPSIDQYVNRKLHPEDNVDKGLSEWNLHWWCSGDIEHAVAEWLYNHGLKK